MKTRLRRSECVRVHVSSSVRTRAPMHVFESLSTLAFDFEPEKGIMECAVPSFFFLLFRVSSREGGGNLLECCSFLSLVYRFSICSLFFYLIIGKKLVLVRHTQRQILSSPKKIYSLIDPYTNIYSELFSKHFLIYSLYSKIFFHSIHSLSNS